VLPSFEHVNERSKSMSEFTLRGLAKAHSDNLVDRKHYIRERRRLIDEIVAGQAELVPYSQTSPTTTPDSDRTFSDGETSVELPHADHLNDAKAAKAADGKSNRGFIFACIVLVVAVIAGAWFKYRAAPQIEIAEQSPADELPRTAASSTNRAVEILSRFIEQNRWGNEQIVEFQTQWTASKSTERTSAAATSGVHRAIDLIAQKYLGENALSTLSSSQEPRIKQRRLLDLGFALSPGNERIKRLDAEWHIANEELEKNTRSVDQNVIAELSNSEASSTAPTVALPESLELATEIPLENDSPDEIAISDEPTVTDSDPEKAKTEAIDNMAEIEPKSDGSEILPAEPKDEPTSDALAVNAPISSKAADESTLASTAELPPSATGKRTAAMKEPLGCRASLAKVRRPYCRDSLAEDTPGPALAVLPNGTFNMGGIRREEQPMRAITIGRPFAVSIFEISHHEFAQFCTAMAITCPPQPWSDPNLPMVNVTWEMASEYTQWLSNKTGAKYRLPTESEWEYAARAGTTTVYPFGDEILPTHARFSFRATESSPLANDNRSINRNNFRLYHMVGNVQEWVQDGWEDSYLNAPSDSRARLRNSAKRVVRGGSYLGGPDKVRSASRTFLQADASNSITGFRIVREVE
jgi:formylglycine-generating enzyme required for sulfatase activity